MGLILNGNAPSKIIYNGTEVSLYFNGSKIWPTVAPPPVITDYVTIGSQVWMSKNLAYDDGQGGVYTQTVNYGQGNVVEYYYTWDAAVRIIASIPGWHLPTHDEWSALATAVGGTSIAGTILKSTYGWNDSGNGTDDYGFAAFPAGYWSDGFISFGDIARFWAGTTYQSTRAYNRVFETGASMRSYISFKTSVYSVRLIKDS